MNTNAIALAINSHECSEDIWEMYFGELFEKGWHNMFCKIYIFSSRQASLPGCCKEHNVELITYNPKHPYNLQYLSCLKKIKEEILVTSNEDCIPSGSLKQLDFLRIVEIMQRKSVQADFIKCVRGEEVIMRSDFKNLYYIDPNSPMYFTQQVSIWKKRKLLEVYSMCESSHIARKGGIQQEILGSRVCREQGHIGYLYYNGEAKRGLYHYDSSIIPHICTAIVGGRWNISEYRNELEWLTKKYKVTMAKRGVHESR
jgi:hypothetical protein